MPAIPKAPPTKHIDKADDADAPNNLVGRIRTFDGDIASFKSRIKTVKEQLDDLIAEMPEYQEVAELSTKLLAAKEHLKRRLESNSQYMHLTEELADERLSLKDAQDNMSEFLLAYFAETKEKQIELAPKDAREVVLKGRLGKPKDYQTNIFSQAMQGNTND